MIKGWFTVFSVIVSASIASAQEQKRPAVAFPMERADANGDGQVSWAEVQQVAPNYTQERFNKLDRNGDGMLSKADAPQRAKPNNAKPAKGNMPQGEQLLEILRRADADGDDRVTKEELARTAPQLAKRGFVRLDTNQDGVISAADRKKRETPAKPAPKAQGASTADAIQQADANGDGKWSYAELKTVAQQLRKPVFERVDADNDGLLNTDEVQELRRLGNEKRKPTAPPSDQGQIRGDAVSKILQSDANGDGEVTFAELAAAKPGFPRNSFDRNDKNNDGVVSRADVP